MSGEPRSGSGVDHEGAEEPLPAIDLATFILSLSHSAQVHFGDAPGPTDDETVRNLAMAKQSIDLLLLLQEKTRGNLTGEEERLLEQTIYELKCRLTDALAKRAGQA